MRVTTVNSFVFGIPLVLSVGCSAPGFVLEPHEGDEDFPVARAVYAGSGLEARSAPGVDEFAVALPEGRELRVQRERSGGETTLTADLDFDGDFTDEQALAFPAAGAAQHIVRPVGATAVRLKLAAGGTVEHRLEPVYTTTLRSGGESLELVTVLFPPEGAILFADPQANGSYSMLLAPETAFGLGGRTFTASVAYDPPRVLLAESEQPTTQPGDPVPPLEGTALGDVLFEEEEGSEVVLVFAHPTCGGCAASSPLADLARSAAELEQRWVWVVGDEAQVAPTRGSTGAEQPVVADAAAWSTFGTSATPTLVRLSAADANGARTVQARVSSAKEDRMLEALGWH